MAAVEVATVHLPALQGSPVATVDLPALQGSGAAHGHGAAAAVVD